MHSFAAQTALGCGLIPFASVPLSTVVIFQVPDQYDLVKAPQARDKPVSEVTLPAIMSNYSHSSLLGSW
jgi:hypothetical protein